MLQVLQIMSFWLALLYFITYSAYIYDFFADKTFSNKAKKLLLFVTLMFHIIYIVQKTLFLGHLPIMTQFEIFSLIAFSIGFTYFLLELLSDIRGTGVFILFFAIIFQTKSSLFIQDIYTVNSVLQNYPLGFHVVSAILGFSAISISSAYSFMYLLLYKNIKSNNFTLLFKRLPNLEILEHLTLYSMFIGFIMLSVSISIGFLWLPSAFPEFSYFDSKIVSTLFVTLLYGSAIVFNKKRIVTGLRFAKFSIYGFIISILFLMLAGMVLNSFHNFTN